MTATEKRYGQTEKRCFSCTLGKGQVQHLPPWSIKGQDQYNPNTVTSSIQQATAQLPPIIEIWVLGMQNVDFELVYKPGIADPRTSYKTPITKEKQWCHRESLQVRCEG